ncbi:unnamed protein product [Echinostoma caproni]|uniref:Ovule protein n=1 Tax=Echinostoma caproni TaxID=27848 RepID=A0A183A0I8_9TREM|nr:unnamed protein product [Echinostoma caproni]
MGENFAKTNESTQPRWAMRLGKKIVKTTDQLTARCRRKKIGRQVKSKQEDANPIQVSATEHNVNGKRTPSELVVISETGAEEDGTELEPICTLPRGPNELETISNGSVSAAGDHVAGNSINPGNVGRMKIQRIKQMHSATSMPGRIRTTESSRVFEITPASVDAKAPGDHGPGISTISAFSVQMPNVEFSDGTMSVTKRTVLAQPSLPTIGEVSD